MRACVDVAAFDEQGVLRDAFCQVLCMLDVSHVCAVHNTPAQCEHQECIVHAFAPMRRLHDNRASQKLYTWLPGRVDLRSKVLPRAHCRSQRYRAPGCMVIQRKLTSRGKCNRLRLDACFHPHHVERLSPTSSKSLHWALCAREQALNSAAMRLSPFIRAQAGCSGT